MSTETAFLGAESAFGRYWTKRRDFDYLIDKDNLAICFGKKFQQIIFLDPALSYGVAKTRAHVEQDTIQTQYLVEHLGDISSECTVFITTCDVLPPDADENTPPLESSEDPYVQNRIDLYKTVNHVFGRVLNVFVPELARDDADFSQLIACCTNPPEGDGLLDFAPQQLHQFYFHERILGDVERAIPLGIPALIPAAPPLTTTEVVEALAPQLLPRLPKAEDVDPVPASSNRTSIHSFHWLDPQDGYFVTKSDQLALLQFYFAGV